MENTGNRILVTWERLSRAGALGKWVFSASLKYFAPYSASIQASVYELRAGYAKVAMKDRRSLHGPFRSLHAMTLANLGELTSGLAFYSGLPSDSRGIVVGFRIEFFKKARGLVTAETDCSPPNSNKEATYEVECVLRNTAEETVAKTMATWKISPKPA